MATARWCFVVAHRTAARRRAPRQLAHDQNIVASYARCREPAPDAVPFAATFDNVRAYFLDQTDIRGELGGNESIHCSEIGLYQVVDRLQCFYGGRFAADGITDCGL